MMTETCEGHRGTLGRIAAGEVQEVPDGLALHLDACPECRCIFDRGAVPIDPDALERLEPIERQRLLRVLVVGRSPRWHRVALAAATLVVLVLGAGWLVLWPRPEGAPSPLVVALAEDHIRYLGRPERQSALGRAALEVDLETYVDFPVSLPASPMADLTGARRCYLLGRSVALGFYVRGSAQMSYFILPAEGLSLPGKRCAAAGFHCGVERGYSVVVWERSGLFHAVVADEIGAALELAHALREGSRV